MAEYSTERFEGWAVLELMGHAKTAGYVKTVELAGHGMVRVDVPASGEGEGQVDRTEYYGPSAIYSLKPVTEEFAKHTARQIGRPVTSYGVESVFRGMSVAELSNVAERLTKLIESRQLGAAESVDGLDPEARPRRQFDDDEDFDD